LNTTKIRLNKELESIIDSGLYKHERIIQSKQNAEISVNGKKVLNFCANNYLGLANHPHLLLAAKEGLERWGFGLSSVRFICGTQTIHKTLENKISEFLQTDDTILYTSCYDANGGLFETFLGSNDAIISDALNHASIIDGIRLCKAQRYRFENSNMDELETILKATRGARTRLIATDGVFSMDGYIAKLDTICNLANKYEALVMVDDSHATGFFGKTGRGTIDYCNVMGQVDIITSTLGKALGGAAGGFTSGRQEIIDILRQRSRPYLFSNTIAPAMVATSIAVIDMLSTSTELKEKLEYNTKYFREKMTASGFNIKSGVHPIVPIMLNDANLAQNVATDMLEEGIYVVGFYFPVVPKGEDRIRVQLSASHTKSHINKAVEVFIKIGKKHNILK